MVMQASGQISFADINAELNQPAGSQLSFADVYARNLSETPTGTELPITTFYSKRTAKGGTITIVGSHTIHRFNSSGQFRISGNTKSVEVLVVAGGGGGASTTSGGGGGGGGGVIHHTTYPAIGDINVIVGAGGPQRTIGSDSYFGPMRAFGGGPSNESQTESARSGGSGGGASHMNPSGRAAPSTQTSNNGGTGYGTAGGASSYDGGSYPQGSGGGAGGAGGVGTAGGIGREFSTSGTSTYYAGGGGMTFTRYNPATAGGLGGGGAGVYSGTGVSGTANLGGGGGGGGGNAVTGAGGAGGSGVVLVRYLT